MTSIGVTILLMVGAAAWLLLLRARSLRAQQRRQASKENRMTLREYIIEHTPLHTVGARRTPDGRFLVVTGAYTGECFLFRTIVVRVPFMATREETVFYINAQIEGKTA